MSNKKFISSSLANLQHSLVFSFDLGENTKDYSLGIAAQDKPGNTLNELHISKDKLKWYNPTLIKFSQLDQNIDSTSFTSQNGFYYVWNTQGKLLGNEIIIVQESIPDEKYHYYIKSKNGTYTIYEIEKITDDVIITDTKILDKNGREILPITLESTDLKYNCYMNTDVYSNDDETEKMVYHNNQYYFKTEFQVIPQLASFQDQGQSYDAILISASHGDIELLSSDYVIKIQPQKYNISTIVAKYKGKIQNTDYIKFADFDRARFVISDYGRIISHAIHKKQSDMQYQQIRPTVFNISKRQSEHQKKVWIKFTVDTPNNISNLTANF